MGGIAGNLLPVSERIETGIPILENLVLAESPAVAVCFSKETDRENR